MDEKPNVEKIVVEIQRRIKEAGGGIPEPAIETAPEEDLLTNLRAANRWVYGVVESTGRLGRLCRRIGFRALGLTAFHASVVRVLNEFAKIISGEKTLAAGTLLAENRKRLELVEQLARRLDEYEGEHVPERLRLLEEEIRRLKSGKSA